jgi:type I restriction enzyme S subunit
MVEYSDALKTDVSWLPKIPAHWELKKINALFSERKTKVSDKDFAPLSVTKKGILPQLEHAAKSNDSDNRKLVKAGDFVINSRSDRKGSCGVSPYDGSVSLINIVLTPRSGLNSQFVHYLLRNYRFSEEYYRNGRGIVADLWTTRYSEMRTILLPVPPRTEQDQIVRFLDWKVSEINKLIGIRQKEIKELNELTRVIVHHAITGKYLNAKTKQSGIEWIGTIPDTWEIRHVKNVANITNGCDPKTEGDIPVYGSGDGAFKTCGEYKEGPTVLIGRKGATLHIPHYVEGKYWNVDTAFDVHMKDKNDLKWFYYLSQCFDYQFYISQTTLPSMTQTDYNNMSIPVPSVSVQRDIASFLDDENSKINKLINLNERKIHALMELKASIISDVVTGKIDVRGITVPQYEHIDDIAEDDSEDVKEETDGEEE